MFLTLEEKVSILEMIRFPRIHIEFTYLLVCTCEKPWPAPRDSQKTFKLPVSWLVLAFTDHPSQR